MCTVNRNRWVAEMMKFSFHHRAFYCYLGMTVWIFFLVTVMYKYMSVDEETIVKNVVHNEYISKSDAKFRKIYMRACNPADSIIRGSEGLVDTDTWLLQGILVATRHGDRGPLTHLRGGDKLPCDEVPVSPLLKSYEEFVHNASSSGRAWWVVGPGPFHNFPSLPPRAAGTRCALGQLTPRGLLQMITVGNILREAYGELLGFDVPEVPGKKDTGEVLVYSTRYRRTFQASVGVAFGACRRRGGALASRARESHATAFCFSHCACKHHHVLNKKINSQAKNRLESHPAIKELVTKMSRVLFESQEHPDADVVRDATLAFMCHDVPLPCTQNKHKLSLDNRHRKLRSNSRSLLQADDNLDLDYNQVDFNNEIGRKARDIIGNYDKKQPLSLDNRHRKLRSNSRSLLQADDNLDLDYNQVDFNNEIGRKARDIIGNYDKKQPLSLDNRHRKLRSNSRSLLQADDNLDLDYNQVDFNNEIGRKARDIIGNYDKKQPLDFDAQMEREKLLYYQQRYIDNAEAYDDVVIVKKNLDADFNFPNDARMDADFDEDYKEPTPDTSEDFCIRKEHVMSLFAYLEWTYRQEIKNIHNRKRGLLLAYGLIHNIVQNMIRMISENKPKFVLYSGHDKTLQALILALGLNNYQHYNIQYASRMIFEVYRRKDLRDEFKFTKRKAVALDFYFRVVYNGEDVTNMLSFCRKRQNVVMKVVHPIDDMKVYKTYLCSIENIVRFIHDDYFASFNASNFKDACSTYTDKHVY